MNAPRTPGRDGFVLVGVVMFVLALTILGLSLFGLSSFEAQFLGGSLSKARAFHAASGGIERAKFALLATDELESVQSGLPGDVVYAVAVKDPDTDPDSTGTLDWTGDQTVLIRVMAVDQDERCMLETRFKPRKPDNYYKRLITANAGVHINLVGGGGTEESARSPQTHMVGEAWQTDPDVSWNGIAQAPWARAVTVKPVPIPDVSGFIGLHKTTASLPYEPSTNYFDLTGGSGPVRYYWSPGDDAGGNPDFSVSTTTAGSVIDIRGAGTVVWMAEHGFRFDFNTEIKGLAGDCLVLVSPRNGRDPDLAAREVGPWFFGGVVCPVPLILVSDDEVRIEHFNDYGQNSYTSYLAVFARHAFIMGPIAGNQMSLNHLPGAAEDSHGALIDQLCELGALPNCGGSLAASFPIVSASWQELDPDAPPEFP